MNNTPVYAVEVAGASKLPVHLTNATQSLRIEGVEFQAGTALTISAIQWRGDEIPASFQLTFPKSVEPQASLQHFLAAKVKLWSNIKDNGSLALLISGEVVEASTDQALITLEVKGNKLTLAKPIISQISYSCRAEFGSKRCGINLTSLMHNTSIETINLPFELSVHTINKAHQYKFGTLSLQGEEQVFTIVGQVQKRLVLDRPLPLSVQAGDEVKLTPGCNKLFATCVKAYQNAINFDGEPDEFNTP